MVQALRSSRPAEHRDPLDEQTEATIMAGTEVDLQEGEDDDEGMNSDVWRPPHG